MAALDSFETNRTHEPRGKQKPEQHKPNFTLRRYMALGGLLVASVVGAHQLAEKGPVQSKTGLVKEYIVKPADTPWTLAQNAYPKDINSASRQFDIRHEIIAQLPDDEAHKDGMLQPGDKLIFSDGSSLGVEIQYQDALKDLSPSGKDPNIVPVG